MNKYILFLLYIICQVTTVWAKDFPCDDLLTMYAEKPVELEFVKCEIDNENQFIARAEYRTAGKYSEKVEKFFISKYGMGKLKRVCCGWESEKDGTFTHKIITDTNPFYIVSISMYASGEYFDKHENTYKLETNRNKIPYFTVIVEIIEM